MEFRILGPLYADAGTGEGPSVIRQPLLQSALAVLLLRANMACPRNWLIEALWDSELPNEPEASLRVCISRLRRDLGDCAGRLESVGPAGGRAPGHRLQRGYKMLVRPGELDVDEFSDLAAQGKAELDTGNASAAAAALKQALALWGDPPLPNLPRTPAVAGAVAELHAKRRAAEEDLIDAWLAAGENERVLGRLRTAVLADPSNERTCVQLMRAYRALGMRKEALDVYRRAREATLTELGAEPGPTLVMLHRRILAEDLTAEGPADQLSRLSPLQPRLPSWQVPAPPPDFTGRSAEVRLIIEALTGPGVPVAVVTGAPGAGKTAAAAATALQLRAEFFDGQLYAELGGLEQPRDPQQVLAEMLHSLGIPRGSIPPPGPGRSALYRSLLADRKVLIVADDAASARQVRPLLPAASGAAVLVTSRGRLTGLAGARIVEVAELPAEDAVALLSSAAGSSRVPAEAAAVADVISACAGLPLALRIAGAALASRPGLTVARLASELSNDRPLAALTSEEMSVSAAISSSYYAVPSPARAAIVFAAAMTPGDVPAWALEELASGDLASSAETGGGSAAGMLGAAGLIAPAVASADVTRYRLHPLVRAYARQRWHDHAAEAAASAARLQAGWLLRAGRAAAALPAVPFIAGPADLPALTGDGEAGGPSHEWSAAASLDWLDAEQANLLAAVVGACDTGQHAQAARLACRLVPGQCIRGRYRWATQMWRAILAAAASDQDQAGQASASYYLALTYAEGHDRLGEAVRLLKLSVPVLDRAGVHSVAAMGHGLLARCASACGRHALAISSARSAQRLACGTPSGQLTSAAAAAVLGLTLARVGMTRTGEDYCQQALHDARVLGQPAYEAAALRALAQVLILAREYRRAADICAEGIRVVRGYGSEITAARFLQLLGRVCQLTGDWLTAADFLHEALAIFGSLGSAIEEVTTSSLLAVCENAARVS